MADPSKRSVPDLTPVLPVEHDIVCPACLTPAATAKPCAGRTSSYHLRCRWCGLDGFANSQVAVRHLVAWRALSRRGLLRDLAAHRVALLAGPLPETLPGEYAVCPLCLSPCAILRPDRSHHPFLQCSGCRLRLFTRQATTGLWLHQSQLQLADPALVQELFGALLDELPPDGAVDPWSWIPEGTR